MSNQFQFGIVVDVVPLDVLNKGWEYLEVPASMHCSAILSDTEWQAQKAIYKSYGRPTPVTAFMLGPGTTHHGASGPLYNPEVIRWSLGIQFERMAELGVKWAGAWGGHFRCPPGFDRSKAVDQAISSINIMADCAEKHGMLIALEPEAEPDTLFPRYLEGIEFAKMTGRRSVKVMADLN
ncbi:MAG: sugar phosphate isomerase/epimerase, partial [Clostridia bacterium]|nr:sugar phosphate isomerase/epimerase [Clostridia bacterium]